MLGGGDGVAGAAKLVASLAHFQAERLGRLNGGVSVAGERCRLGLGVLQCRLGAFRISLQGFEPASLDEAGARRRSRAGSDGVAVPAPEIAFGGDEPLARLEPCLQSLALRALNHADLGEPALERGRARDELAQSYGTFRQLRIAFAWHEPPMRGGGLVASGIEIVAEARAKRLLVA